MSASAWIETTAAARPDAVALVTPAGALGYGELLERARATADELRAAGVVARRRVALQLPAGERFVAALHACALLDAVALPVDPRLTAGEVERRVAGVAAAITEGGVEARPGPHRREPPGVALLVHTSGTTSEPKPVRLTGANVEANAGGVADALGLDARDRWLCPMPLAHVGGLMIPLRCAILGAAVALLPFDARAVNAALAEQPVTVLSCVPTMLARMLDAGLADPPRLRVAMLGGGPAAPALLARAHAAGVPVAQTYGLTEAGSTVPVAQTYGLTEAGSTVTVSRAGEAATAGRAIPGVRVTVAPDGEIVVQGPVLAPQAGPILRTGDLGTLDEQGNLTVRGRKADTIVSGGENVAPQEVEAVLLAHPAIADAGVHAVPDPEWGEAVVARLVLRDGARAPSDAELRAFCRERLAAFKLPKRFDWDAELPRNAAGKLLRRELIEKEPALR